MRSALDAALVRRAVEVIDSGAPLALACHVHPDGDALGSALAMHHLAVANGHRSVVAWPEPTAVARHYRSLPGLDAAVCAAAFPAEPAVMCTFDCGSTARLGELAAPAMWAKQHGELIVIDHHATNERFGTINLVDSGAAATAVVVRELAGELGWQLTRDAAMCLYVGLVTDTGRFQYDATTPDVFALAEELAGFDLPVARLSRELFEEHSFAYVQLAGSVLSRATLDRELGFVFGAVGTDDLEHFGVDYSELEGLIDWIRTTAEAEVACLCKATPQGQSVSLRSLSSVDVGEIARRLGGGGHRYAAGFTMLGSADFVANAIRTELRAARARS